MRPHPRRAATDPNSPRAWATSDRNGFVNNHEKLHWQWDWAGSGIINKRILVSEDELDKPQRQLGTLILPPDPPPIKDARPEQYYIDEQTLRYTQGGIVRGEIATSTVVQFIFQPSIFQPDVFQLEYISGSAITRIESNSQNGNS